MPLEPARHGVQIRVGPVFEPGSLFDGADGEVLDFQCRGTRISSVELAF